MKLVFVEVSSKLLHVFVFVSCVAGLTNAAKLESINNTFTENPTSEIGTMLFQLGNNFCDRDKVREYFLSNYKEFAEIYRNRPEKLNLYGVRINHAFAVTMVTKVLAPITIIESGVNAGQTTYYFRKSAPPNALIISLDPMAESNKHQGKRWIDTTNNVYLTGDKFRDITSIDWKTFIPIPGGGDVKLDMDSTLVFIDDHQRTLPRMRALYKQGFTNFLIEDNYAFGHGASVLERGYSPKTVLLGRSVHERASAHWLKKNMETYHEVPPIFYGNNTLSDRKKYNRVLNIHLLQGNFSILPSYAPPLFRTDRSEESLKLAVEFRDLVGNDFVKDYNDYMCYNHIAYIKMKKA